MQTTRLRSKFGYVWVSLGAAFGFGITQLPTTVQAATTNLTQNTDDLTEAVFIGLGLLLSLLGLFELDAYRTRHPRQKKTARKQTQRATQSASAQR